MKEYKNKFDGLDMVENYFFVCDFNLKIRFFSQYDAALNLYFFSLFPYDVIGGLINAIYALQCQINNAR